MKIKKTIPGGGGFRSGGKSGWGVRVDVNKELKFCENSKKSGGGGVVGLGGGRSGGQCGCEHRSKSFGNIQKKIGGGVGGPVEGVIIVGGKGIDGRV